MGFDRKIKELQSLVAAIMGIEGRIGASVVDSIGNMEAALIKVVTDSLVGASAPREAHILRDGEQAASGMHKDETPPPGGDAEQHRSTSPTPQASAETSNENYPTRTPTKKPRPVQESQMIPCLRT
ncbi:hypothetical protein Bca52824_026711 [Brassica carinata]|uniref:Uncharacterized protein n=1 Tax=Brassica carinata TaxID=52824 RepID=A0A8X7SID8_BRACI|nr:hypothetical protein Bca52824_026711 [Brassica carinata]